MSRLAQPGGGVGRRAGGGISPILPGFAVFFAARSRNPLISLRYEVVQQDLDTVLGYQNTSRIREIGGAGSPHLVNQSIGIVN